MTKGLRPLIASLFAGLLGLVALTGCGSTPATSSAASNTVVIGSKNFTENEILAQMMADLLQKDTNLKVTTKLNMNGTIPVFEAIKSAQIDIYPEYTGTGYMEILKKPKAASESAMYAYVRKAFQSKYGLEWLKPFGFNDTYALAVTNAYAQAHHITTISDLVPYAPTLLAGIDPECQNRPDCLPGLEKTYGLKFKGIDTMDHSLVEEAMASGKIQVTDVYTTDGALLKYHLTVLKDNKNFFPAYLAAPLVRMAWAKAHPQAVTVLNKLAGKLTTSEMERLDYQVDIGNESVQQVAKAWLVKEGLL